MNGEFTEVTHSYLRRADIKRRKSLGQYFTPRTVREHLLSQLPKRKQARVLDPASGTGEFLLSAQEYFGDCQLVGWEIDPGLVKLSRQVIPKAQVIRQDSLKHAVSDKYDFVIGNPPYFEFKPDPATRARFSDVISGRANIFSMFIKLGLEMLRAGGYLAYVIPPSMNNGAYFTALRSYIERHANIEYLSVLDSPMLFDRAHQTVMIMVLKKGPNRGDYIFARDSLRIFATDPKKLKRAFAGKSTLNEHGFVVRTGKIVWNQHRDKLTTSPRGAVPLIWSHNLNGNSLTLGNLPGKPQYIRHDRFDTGPAIVVNRVTGLAHTLHLKAVLIKRATPFLGENHVNVIYPPKGTPIGLLQKIANQISDPSTVETMR
ncbi:MAG: N-6 DNA methylase, partial [candidate division Zixibacteria bacterium]|nr:N-6 DNA methylase [candidate division Zixibacteria bacterium]